MGGDHVAASSGPTLYLESGRLDPTEAFCSEVFEGTADDEYRVLQLTASRSFDSLQHAFDVQLADINDPSAAAVILLTPQDDDETSVVRVGEDTPLYGVRVDPQDLTGISVAFSRLLDQWSDSPDPVRICLRNLESLFPYHDTDLVYRFLNTVLATLQGAGADVHAHVQPSLLDDRSLSLTKSLFATIVDADSGTSETVDTAKSLTEPAPEPAPKPAAGSPDVRADLDAEPEDGDGDVAQMSAEEIAAFLTDAGHGILAFDGSPPYALPMTYGYDAATGRCYFQFATYDDSEKQSRLEDSATVSLVVTRYTRPDRWRSVIVDGELTRLSEADLEDGVPRVFATGDLASVDIFTRNLDEIGFAWYALDPTSVSGRRSVGPP